MELVKSQSVKDPGVDEINQIRSKIIAKAVVANMTAKKI